MGAAPSSPEELFRRKLMHLKDKGISDPNIDLFLAVTGPRDDPEPVRIALERGADLTMTDVQLLDKYRDEFEDFDEATA